MAHVETKTTYSFDEAHSREWRLGTFGGFCLAFGLITAFASAILFFADTTTIPREFGAAVEIHNWSYLLLGIGGLFTFLFYYAIVNAAADIIRLLKLRMNYPYYGDIAGLIFSHKAVCSNCESPVMRDQTKCNKCGESFEQVKN